MAREINTIANRITLEGGAEILKFLDSLGKDGEAAAKKMRDAFQKSGFDKGVTEKVGAIRRSLLGLGADARIAANSLTPLRSALAGLQALASGLFSGVGLAGGLGIAGLGAAIASLTVKFGENASALQNQADSFGINTDLLQKYQREMTLANQPVAGLDRLLTSLSDKLADNDQQLKTNTKTFEVFGDKTVEVVKGVRGIDAESGKLKQSFDFTVPTNELGKLGEKTITVTRGAQDLNEQLKKRSDLLDGLTSKQFQDGTALDELSRRIQNYTNQVQALIDAGFDRRGSAGFAKFLNEHFNALQLVEEQAKSTGKTVSETNAILGDGLVPIFKPEQIAAGVAVNTELDKVAINLSTIAQNLATSDILTDFLRNFNFGLEEISAGLPTVRQGLSELMGLLSGGGPGAGLNAGTGLLPTAAKNATEAKTEVDKLSESLGLLGSVEIPTTALDDFGEVARTAAENATKALSETGQNVRVSVPAEAFDEFELQARNAAEQAAGGLPTPFERAWAEITSDANSALSSVRSLIGKLIADVARAIASVENLKASASAGGGSSGGGFGGGGGSGFAYGGVISGPGGPRGDRIPIWASDGEFMIQTKAAQKVGYDFLRMVNSGRYNLEELFRALSAGKFADGGLITALERSFPAPRMPKFAAGGMVTAPAGGGQPVILQLPSGEQIRGIQATPGAMEQLARATVRGKLLTTRTRLL